MTELWSSIEVPHGSHTLAVGTWITTAMPISPWPTAWGSVCSTAVTRRSVISTAISSRTWSGSTERRGGRTLALGRQHECATAELEERVWTGRCRLWPISRAMAWPTCSGATGRRERTGSPRRATRSSTTDPRCESGLAGGRRGGLRRRWPRGPALAQRSQRHQRDLEIGERDGAANHSERQRPALEGGRGGRTSTVMASRTSCGGIRFRQERIWRSGRYDMPLEVTDLSNLQWKVAGMGDFNGDSKDDLVWRNTSTGANSVWLSANSATPMAVTAVPQPGLDHRRGGRLQRRRSRRPDVAQQQRDQVILAPRIHGRRRRLPRSRMERRPLGLHPEQQFFVAVGLMRGDERALCSCAWRRLRTASAIPGVGPLRHGAARGLPFTVRP